MKVKIEYLLLQYARWCHDSPGRVSSPSLVFIQAAGGGGCASADISDDVALKIGDALTALARENPDAFDVVGLSFLQSIPCWRIQEMRGLSKQRVAVLKEAGVYFIDGRLSFSKAA